MSEPGPIDPVYRFLVIDRDELGGSIRRMFPADHVVVATDATAACLRIVEAEEAKEPFDVILCSLAITKLGERSLVEIARTGKTWPVFLYVMSYVELDALASAPEADGFLVIPLTTDEIEALIWKVLVERDRARTRHLMSLDN